MSWSLSPDAEEELNQAAAYYREQVSAALAAAFLDEFDRAARLLVEHPSWPRTADLSRAASDASAPVSLLAAVSRGRSRHPDQRGGASASRAGLLAQPRLERMLMTRKVNVNRPLILGLLLFAFSSFVFAQTDRLDSASWVKRGESAPQKFWLIGYMMGLRDMWDARKLQPSNPLRELQSMDQAVLWVDNYCKENPLDSPELAGTKLFLELAARAMAKRP